MILGIVAEGGEETAPVIPPAAAKFIAVGQDSVTSEAVIMRSEDGNTWIAGTQPGSAIGSSAALFGITHNGSRWVAVGQDGFREVVVFTSDDGTNWTQRDAALGVQGGLFAVCWVDNTAGGRFIGVGQIWLTQFPLVMVSNDGITWTQKTSVFPSTAGNWLDVEAIDGLAIAVGCNQAGTTPWIMRSTNDGDAWASQTPAPTTNWSVNGIAIDNTTTASFAVAVGNATGSTPRIASSPTGTTWTQRTGAPSSGVSLFCVAWSAIANLFIAIGYDFSTGQDPKIMTSPDGITWTARTAAPTTGANFEGIAVATDGSIIAAGHTPDSSAPKLSSSADGITWVTKTPAGSQPDAVLYDIAARL